MSKLKNRYPPSINVRRSGLQVVKKDLNDYSYAKDIDEKVINLAISLAEKMAISIIREGLRPQIDTIIEEMSHKLADKIAAKLPAQQTIIRQIADSSLPELQDYDFKVDLPGINRATGLTLKGQGVKKVESEDSIDDALNILDNMSN